MRLGLDTSARLGARGVGRVFVVAVVLVGTTLMAPNASATPKGCTVLNGPGSCSYASDGGYGAYTVASTGGWSVKINGVTIASATGASATTGPFYASPGATVLLSLGGIGSGVIADAGVPVGSIGPIGTPAPATACAVQGHVRLDPFARLLTGGLAGSFLIDSGSTASCAGKNTFTAPLYGSGYFDGINAPPVTYVSVSSFATGPCSGSAAGDVYGNIAILTIAGTTACGHSGVAIATFAPAPSDIDVTCSVATADICLMGAHFAGALVMVNV